MVRVQVFILLFVVSLLLFGRHFLPPRLLLSFPGNKDQEVPLSAKVELIFDRAMVRSTVEKALSIRPPIPGTMTWEGDQKLIFTPRQNLTRATTYTVELKGIPLSRFFIPFFGKRSFSFETLGNPKIVIASPRTEALEDLMPITVVFDRPMIALTTATNSAIRTPAFTIEPHVAGEGRWLGTTAYQYRPSEPFRKATTYHVTIVPGITSVDNGTLPKDAGWEFSSERPRVDRVTPEHDYAYASPIASVAAFFNQDIDPKSAHERIRILDENNKAVLGRVVSSENMVAFWPASPLMREKRYTAILEKGLKGTDGPNGMVNDYQWTFTIAASPAIIETSPKRGEKEVAEQYRAEILFRTPMDDTSFEGNVTIDPQPDMKPSVSFYSYEKRHSLSIGTYFGRSKQYRITIGANVKDQYGVPLGRPYTLQFTTSPYKPAVSIYPFGTYFGAFNQDIVPRIVSQVTNAGRVDYVLYKLNRENFLDLYRRRYGQQCTFEDCRNWQNYDASKLEKIRTWTETFEAELNTPVHVVTKVTDANGGKIPPGIYFLDVRIPQGAHDNMVMIVSKSALTVKKSDKQIFAWSVNQSSGKVIPGMKMQLTDSSGAVLKEGVTNGDGVFMETVNLFKKYDLFVFGQKDNDVVVAASAWSEGIDRSDFGLPSYYSYNEYKDYDSEQAYKLYLTVDRPIFRPGQKVNFKGLVRKDTDGAYETLSPGVETTVSITDANGREVYKKNLPLSTFGSYSGDFMLSKEANLGYYNIKSVFQGNTFTQQFQVEEYRKPDLAVSVNPSKSSYSQGENAHIAVNASYYFGAPVTNAPVAWTLQTQDYSFRWDKDTRFEFGDPESYWSWWYYTGSSYYSGKKVTEGSGKTNTKGDFELNIPLDIRTEKTSQQMTVEAVVNDETNNQSIASSQMFTVHRAGLYAGLRPVRYANQAGKEAGVEIVTVDLKGAEVPNTQVNVEFFKRTWETVREQNPDDGIFYYTSKATDTRVAASSVTTDANGRGVAVFTPAEGGTYKAVSTVTDTKGNKNTSGSYLWVSGYGFVGERTNNDRIILVTDKRDYLVGENVSVFVASPYASSSATTLLTAERGTVLDYKLVETSESSNNFSLPIPSKYTPNVFIGAVVMKGGSEIKSPPEFKIGYSEIKVTDQKKHLTVRITTDKKKYQPRETLKATIETRDQLGKPVSAELAVGLVDKAVWDLSSVELPDIYKTFYQPRNLDVQTSQLLTISIDRINANTNLGSKGGSGGGCFTGDTPVLMKGRVTKNIKDIDVGDIVLTRKGDALPELMEAKVTRTYKHLVDQYLIINGTLRVTPVHRMFVNGRWTTAGLIRKGDLLIDSENIPIRVFSVEQVHGSFDVYNLEIEKYRTYFAGNVYVHNQKGMNDTTRTNFPDTAYWNPSVVTDTKGKATLSIPLPDSLTTWRLGAVANSQRAAFGSETTEVIVSREVMIRPFLPRFLSVGDEAQIGAVVMNTSGNDQTFIITLTTEGIELKEGSRKAVTIADGEQTKAVWKTRTLMGEKAKVTLTVQDAEGITKDSIVTTLPVKSYSVPEVVATAGEAKDTAQENIILPSDIDVSQGKASITFSPSLGGSSFESLSYLRTYPYYCVEQTTSKFMPSVFVHRLLKNASLSNIGSITQKSLAQDITDGIQRLNTQQHADGGWGWWSEYESSPFLSAYAFYGLVEARKDKFTVSDATLKKAQGYLVNALAYGREKITPDVQTYILYVLRGRGENLTPYATALYERRFELSIESRAYLAMVLWDSGLGSRAKGIYDELVSLAKKTATTTHWEETQPAYYFMSGNASTTASVLELMTTMNNRNPLIPEVIRYFMTSQHNNMWSSTRDTAAVIKAIALQLLSKGTLKVNERYRFSLNGVLKKEGTFTAQDLLSLVTQSISISQLKPGTKNTLQISKSGEGNLYYNINLKYYLPFSETKPLEQGIVVIREMVDGAGKILPTGFLPQNTEAWIRLTIVAPEERHYVIVEDILPAGLESVNESLKNVRTLNGKAPLTQQNDFNWYYFRHKEYHDDRTTLFADFLPSGVYEIAYRVRATTPGRYHYPPAQAYQMYVPDVSGHSDGGWFEVQ